jgi:hypothetical protein
MILRFDDLGWPPHGLTHHFHHANIRSILKQSHPLLHLYVSCLSLDTHAADAVGSYDDENLGSLESDSQKDVVDSCKTSLRRDQTWNATSNHNEFSHCITSHYQRHSEAGFICRQSTNREEIGRCITSQYQTTHYQRHSEAGFICRQSTNREEIGRCITSQYQTTP